MNLLFLLAYSSNLTFIAHNIKDDKYYYRVDYYCKNDCKGLIYCTDVLFSVGRPGDDWCRNGDSFSACGIYKCKLPEQTLTPELTPEQTPEITPYTTPMTTAEQTPEITPMNTLAMTPEQTPMNTPNATYLIIIPPEQTPEITSKEVEYIIVESKEQDVNKLLIYIIVALLAFIILTLFIVIIYCCCKRRTQEYSSSTSTMTIEVPKKIITDDQILKTISIFEDTDPFEDDFVVSDGYFDQMEK